MNRKKFKKNENSRERLEISYDDIQTEAIQYIEKCFPHHYGNYINIWIPYTHKNAKKWFQYFLELFSIFWNVSRCHLAKKFFFFSFFVKSFNEYRLIKSILCY